MEADVCASNIPDVGTGPWKMTCLSDTLHIYFISRSPSGENKSATLTRSPSIRTDCLLLFIKPFPRVLLVHLFPPSLCQNIDRVWNIITKNECNECSSVLIWLTAFVSRETLDRYTVDVSFLSSCTLLGEEMRSNCFVLLGRFWDVCVPEQTAKGNPACELFGSGVGSEQVLSEELRGQRDGACA